MSECENCYELMEHLENASDCIGSAIDDIENLDLHDAIKILQEAQQELDRYY